jgi:hypothetical protein
VPGWLFTLSPSQIHRKVGGSYVQLAGLSAELQGLLRNIFVMCVSPPGVTEAIAMEPFLYQVQELEAGVLIDFGPHLGDIFVIGGLLMGRRDLPQRCDDTGSLNHNADCGCPNDLVQWSELGDMMFDPLKRCLTDRMAQSVLATGREIMEAHPRSKSRVERLCKLFGLKPGRLGVYGGGKYPIRASDRLSNPVETFHQEVLGIACQVVCLVLGLLTKPANKELNARLASLRRKGLYQGNSLPKKVKLQTKEEKLKNTRGAAYAPLAEVLPFLLYGWLDTTKVIRQRRQPLQERLGEQWLDKVMEAVCLYAQSLQCMYTLKPSGRAALAELDDLIRRSRSCLLNVWPDNFIRRMNCHSAVHIAPAYWMFGCGGQCDCRRLETFHGLLRGAPTNHLHPEVSMMKRACERMALNVWASGAWKHLLGYGVPGPKLIKYLMYDKVCRMMLDKLDEANTYAEGKACDCVDDADDPAAPPVALKGCPQLSDGDDVDCADVCHAAAIPTAGSCLCAVEGVSLSGRPRHERDVTVGDTFEVYGADGTNALKARVSRLVVLCTAGGGEAIGAHAIAPAAAGEADASWHSVWVRVETFEEVKGPHVLGCPVFALPPPDVPDRSQWMKVTSLLRFVSMHHLCGEDCETMGVGFDGVHGPGRVYLHNVYFLKRRS